VTAVAFNADASKLAWGDLQGEIRISDPATGVAQLGIAAHKGQVLKLAFDERGRLLSGGEDRTLNRWPVGLLDSLEEAIDRACALANRRLAGAEAEKFLGDAAYEQSCPD